MKTETTQPPGATGLRRLSAYCWSWGAVTAYRRSGGTGYPSLSHLHGQVYRPVGGMSLSAMGACFTDVERWLRSEPPILKDLLFFQYGRPQLLESARTSISDYIETVFGELPPREHDRVRMAISLIRRTWVRRVLPSVDFSLEEGGK